MKDDGPQLSVQPVSGQSPPANSFDGMLRIPSSAETLDTTIGQDVRSPYQDADAASAQTHPLKKLLLTRIGLGALIFLITASVIFIAVQRSSRNTPVQAGNFKSTHLPLGSVIGTSPIKVNGSPTLSINGQLLVSKTLTIAPSAQPDAPTMGQIYYDNASNVLSFYNGTEFVPMGGTTIQNTTNVTNVTNAGGGASSLTASGGAAGVLAKFTGGQTLGPSIFSESGSTGSVGGNLNIVTANAQPQAERRLWPNNPTPTVTDESGDSLSVEVGVKFQVDVSGFITGMRFYKGATNTGTHVGTLWSTNGTALGTATFADESATGWQEVSFSSPIPVAAETTYVASYHATGGHYAHDDHYFTSSSQDNGPLHALQDGSDGGNGVFKYGATPTYPSGAFNSQNYWVDVNFKPNPPPSRYQVNGVQIASSDLANNTDIAKRTSSQLFSGINTFRSPVASTSAFSIQDVNGTAMLTADTTSSQLVVGTPGGDVTGVVFVLSNRRAPGDPAGAEGGTYFNASSSMFRCYRNAQWGPCATLEAESAYSVYDEFMGGATSGNVSSLGWSQQAIGANGAISFNPASPAPSADRPGVLELQTPAVSNQGSTLTLANSNGGSMLLQKGTSVKTAVAVGSNTNVVLRVGLHPETTGTAQPVSGAWFEANTAVSPNWRFCVGDGTVANCTTTGTVVAANSWMRFEIRVTATGVGSSLVGFGMNGDFFNVSSTTVDTGTRLSPAMSCFTLAATAKTCYWDYFQLTGTTSNFR